MSSVVLASDFDPKRVSLEIVDSSSKNAPKGFKRVIVKYDYGKRDVRDLWLAIDKKTTVECRGVFAEKFIGEDTGGYITTFVLDGNNNEHIMLHDALDAVKGKIVEFENDRTGARSSEDRISFPWRLSDDNGKMYVYCRMIKSRDGNFLTKVFDKKDNEIEDIPSIRSCMCMPTISLSYPIVKPEKVNVRASIRQMVVVKSVSINVLSS
jgi:hypothetical protein